MLDSKVDLRENPDPLTIFRFNSFTQLANQMPLLVDFCVTVQRRSTGLAFIAIHGGEIEPGSDTIATQLAGDTHSLYTFSPATEYSWHITPDKICQLKHHITSARFDHEEATQIVKKSDYVVSVHGFAGFYDDPKYRWC